MPSRPAESTAKQPAPQPASMSASLKIASWNINSVRARVEIVEKFLTQEAPDILCLQETKVRDSEFPEGLFRRLGYDQIIICGQPMHHGVAIVSRLPMREDDRHDWQDNGEARHVGVRLDCGIRLENVYIPAGGDVPDRAVNPKFGQKLDFIGRMTRWSEGVRCPTIVVGDFNVAPLECDVWSHKQLINVVSHTPIEVDALRRGWPVAVGEISFLAVETADEEGLAEFDGDTPSGLLIAGNRAATLKLTNQREALPTEPVLIVRAPWIDLAAAIAVADPALDLAYPLKGPFKTAPLCSPPTAEAAMRLARLAGLLPALFTRRDAPAEMRVAADDVMTFGSGADLRIVSRARLPSRFAEKAEIVAFRSDGDTAEHVALIVGDPAGEPPLVRVHSECLTGDALGSLKCDCGPQLSAALEAIAASGWGILLYLRQEGRSIGLVNKL